MPITLFAYGFVFVSAAGLNALGRPVYGMIFSAIRSILFYVSFIFIGVKMAGLTGAFAGLALANLFGGAIAWGWVMCRVPMTAKTD